MTLAKAWFPTETEEQQWQRCLRLLETSSRRKIVQVAGVKEAIEEMLKTGEADEKQAFKALAETIEHQETEELIKSRVNQPRGLAEYYTPAALKALTPDVQGCRLVYQVNTATFQAYYPKPLSAAQRANPKIKKDWSTSRTYGQKWTKHQALTLVVRAAWAWHGKCKKATWPGLDCKGY